MQRGKARPGGAGQGKLGVARRGSAGPGAAGRGRARPGVARQGKENVAWQGSAWLGTVRQGKGIEAGLREVWRCVARHGWAGPGEARHGMENKAGCDCTPVQSFTKGITMKELTSDRFYKIQNITKLMIEVAESGALGEVGNDILNKLKVHLDSALCLEEEKPADDAVPWPTTIKVNRQYVVSED